MSGITLTQLTNHSSLQRPSTSSTRLTFYLAWVQLAPIKG